MEEQWLRKFREMLNPAGLDVMGAYPDEPAPHPSKPLAALEWGEMDCGKVQIRLHVLSPKSGGGSLCRNAAARAAGALHQAGMDCACSKMRYDRGYGCFRVEITVKVSVFFQNGEWNPGKSWQIFANGQPVAYAEGFEAEQDLHRRILCQIGQRVPTEVTAGNGGGWKIRLNRVIPAGQVIPVLPAEPVDLTVSHGGRSWRYTGCRWSAERVRLDGQAVTVVQWGYAMEREERNGTAEI